MAASLWNPGTNTTQTTPASQPFSFVKNTVANPGINFVGDTNTGIWSQADGWLNFVVDGVTKLSISPTGEVTANNFVSGVELDIVSAATTDLGTVDSNSIRITGTNTITSFGVNYRGPKYIRFAASLTLQNSSSLLCPGGANISISAGDTIIVTPKATSGVADGWVVISYVRSTVAADLSNTVRVDVPSADNTVLLLSSIGSRNVRITGTTPITSFTADNGGLYFVTFAASLTLVNSATLVTNSGDNITTRAGDTCIIRATAYSVVEIMSYDYAVTASFGQGGQIAGMRNKIINGKMEIAQRGTSFAAIASGAYSLDRWAFGNTSSAVGTVSQQSDVPSSNEFQSSLRYTVTTADSSIASGDITWLQQKIEGFNARDLIGRSFVLSFWVRSSKTGTHCVSFANGGGATDRTYVVEYSIISANTWEQKSVIVLGGLITAGTWNWTSGAGVVVQFALASGSTFNTTANAWQTGNFLATASQVNCLDTVGNIFAITGVQLEVGSVATPFEHRPFGAELALCQRYYEVLLLQTLAYFQSTTAGKFVIHYKVTKRAAASTTYLTGTWLQQSLASTFASGNNVGMGTVSLTQYASTDSSTAFDFTCAIAVTGTVYAYIFTPQLAASAEL